jgi:hypothetical protein
MRKVTTLVLTAMWLVLTEPLIAHAAPADDMAFWVENPGQRSSMLAAREGPDWAIGTGAVGPPDAPVAITADFSELDSSRITGFLNGLNCVQTGQTWRCVGRPSQSIDTSIGAVHLHVVPGAAGGPAGFVTLTGERLDAPDPDPSNNTMRIDADIHVPGYSDYTYQVDDAEGSVGDTVSVAATIFNRGPNTIQDVYLAHPTGGGGIDFAGGDDCVTTPAPRCDFGNVPPGTSKTIHMRFHVRRCFRPIPGDPEYGASTLGSAGLRFNYGDAQRRPLKETFTITVKGCPTTIPAPAVASPTYSTPAPSLTPSTPTTPPMESPSGTDPPTDASEPKAAELGLPLVSWLGSGLFLGLAGVLGVTRLHRRRTGL